MVMESHDIFKKTHQLNKSKVMDDFFFACGGHSVVKGPVEIIPVRYPRNSSTSRNHPSHLHVVPSWREQLVMGYANNFWNAGLLAFYKLGTQKHMGLEA